MKNLIKVAPIIGPVQPTDWHGILTAKDRSVQGFLQRLKAGELPDVVKDHLIHVVNERTADVLANKIVYPNPEDITQHFATTAADKRLPDWRLVERALIDMLYGFKLAGAEGNLVFGEENLEFCDDRKARWFLGAYKQIVWRHHLMAFEEVTPEAVQTIAKATAYRGFCTKPNNRGQAVGLVANEERLEIIGDVIEVTEITDVQGVPELRPALVANVRDRVTSNEFGFAAVHLKSMLGGELETAPIRREQIEKLIAKLGPNWKGVIAGDFNFHMDKADFQESKAFAAAGFKLVAPGNNVSTQKMGGRIDGFYQRGMGTLTMSATVPMWNIPKVGRGFTDHGLTRCQKVVRKAKSTSKKK
jgi:hypothetical protein